MAALERRWDACLRGEALFQNIYTAQGGQGMIALHPVSQVLFVRCRSLRGNGMIVQKRAFLAAESGVELSIHFQKRFSSGLFGGEGFIMQRLSGQGMAFIEIDGSAWNIVLLQDSLF